MIRLTRNFLPIIGLYQSSGIARADNTSYQPIQCQDYQHLLTKALSPPYDMPRAWGGKTIVYLPKEASKIALKRSGNEQANRRFQEMESTRAILQEQKSIHLVIPKVTICGDFLVEERLPVHGEQLHNMGIYIAGPSLFDDAVREMVRLFSKVYLSDLIDWQKHLMNKIVGDSVRYDNLPLYIEEENGVKKGKIGLIDLEHIRNPHPCDYYFRRGVLDLARIFPYHAGIIIDEAKKLNKPLDEGQIKLLEEKASIGKKYLQKAYIEHYDFLTKKGITDESCTESFVLPLKREVAIAKAVEKKILEIRFGWMIGYLKSLSLPKAGWFKAMTNTSEKRKMAQEFSSAITPLLLQRIKFLIQQQQHVLPSMPKENISRCIIKRSVILEFNNVLYSSEQGKLIIKLMEECYDNELYHGVLPRGLLEVCISTVLEELVKGEEIFSFVVDQDRNLAWIQF